MKNTVATLAAMKRNGEKISQLTCYDYSTAKIIDAAGINMILVGDSLGMTMQGYKDTLPVTVDEMIVYGRSVVRGCKETFVVVDMPARAQSSSRAEKRSAPRSAPSRPQAFRSSRISA